MQLSMCELITFPFEMRYLTMSLADALICRRRAKEQEDARRETYPEQPPVKWHWDKSTEQWDCSYLPAALEAVKAYNPFHYGDNQ